MSDSRTPHGALMRSAFAEAERQLLTIPDGRRGVMVVAVDQDGAEVGAAFRTRRGWTIEPILRVEVIEKKRTVSFVTRIMF